MAAPAPGRAHVDAPRVDRPPLDPRAYRRGLRRARARRQARLEHQLELKRARVRFLFLLLGLLFLAVLISLSIWEKVETLFGI